MKNKYRSKLYQAKNLGASGSGSHHWWHQRFTALLIALMTFWVFYFFSELSVGPISQVLDCLQNPLNAIMLVMFLTTSMYHGVLGIQVVIEDYVHCRLLRLTLVLTTQICAIFTAVAFIVTILYVMRL